MSRLRQEELPPEILSNVLARLPVHVLHRLRLVCKAWNALITQPGFPFCHSQAVRETPYVLVSPKVVNFDPGGMELFGMMLHMDVPDRHIPDRMSKWAMRRGWETLDMAEKRFYTLTDSFIEDYLLNKVGERASEYCGWDKYTLASDGGLIYALYHGGITQIRRHIVCNPVSRTWHQIPEPDFSCKYNHDIVVLSVDNNAMYRIVTVEAKPRVRSRPEEVHLYDSATKQWRMLCEVPVDYRAWSCVFFQTVFYTLFVDTARVPWYPTLYSCDLETGAWSHIDVELPRPSHLQDKSQLVVSLGRLFLVEYTGVPIFSRSDDDLMTAWEELVADSGNVRNKQLIKVSILEILLAEKEVIQLAAAKYSKYPRRMLDRPQHVIGNPVVAVGCGNSIVISSLLGRRLGFDLVRNCWDERLPENSYHMYDTNRHGAYDRQGMFAGILDLDLREMVESQKN